VGGLDFFDGNHVTPAVSPARRTDPVRELGFPALRAEGERRRAQRVMSAPLITSRARNLMFWIGHV
jgi:hypothetical protein